MHAHKAKIFFCLGVVTIFGVIGMMGVFQAIGNAGTTTLNTNEPIKEYQTGDPLVTVVPESIRGGKPHPLPTDPQRGAKKPTVTFVEFGDFECQNCAAMQSVIEEIVAEYPEDVLHVWKDFPLPNVHPYAESAAQAARCAHEQGEFWEYHKELLERQSQFPANPFMNIAEELELNTTDFSTCMEAEDVEDLVVQSYFVARSLGLEETPSYYINDRVVTGPKTYDELKEIIDNEIDEAKK